MEYDYEYQTTALTPGVILLLIVLSLLVYAFMWWKVFTKAGHPGWASMIPIYNLYIMTKIGGKPGYWTLLCLIPFINFIFIIWLWNMVSKSFGKDEAFTIGLVMLSIIFWPILGFGSAKYLGPYGDPAAFAAYQGKNQFDFEQK